MDIVGAQMEASTTTGDLYLPEEDTHETCLAKLDPLKSLHVFIIQRKATVQYFSTQISYEIMDTKKNVIFKATIPKPIFSSGNSFKISVRNLKNDKILSLVVEHTINSIGSEATVYIYPKKRIAHVEKYASKFGPPCYEIFNRDRKTVFTIDHVMKKDNTTILEYDVTTKTGSVANIIMKTGLNTVLSTHPCMPNLEKATLIGVMLAMVVMKSGTRTPKDEPSTNNYLLN